MPRLLVPFAFEEQGLPGEHVAAVNHDAVDHGVGILGGASPVCHPDVTERVVLVVVGRVGDLRPDDQGRIGNV